MPAVIVGRRRLHRQVDQAKILVDGDLRPDTGVAVDGPRLVLPRVVAELARTRNRVERPQQLARPHVERAHQALGVVVRGDRRAFPHGGADDRDVFHDRRGRVDADLTGFEIDLLAFSFHDAELQVEDAALAERRHQRAGSGVQLDHLIAGRDVDHALIALAVGPIRDPATRELPRRNRGAPALTEAVGPDHFARPAVERDDRSAGAAGGVQHALDRQRRALQLVFGPGAQVVGLEPPGDLELVEIRAVDLVERRIPGALHVRGVVRPVAVSGRGLARGLAREPSRQPHQADDDQGQRRDDPNNSSGHRSTPSDFGQRRGTRGCYCVWAV